MYRYLFTALLIHKKVIKAFYNIDTEPWFAQKIYIGQFAWSYDFIINLERKVPIVNLPQLFNFCEAREKVGLIF